LIRSSFHALYTGVTNYPARRIYQHREGFVAGFTRKYGVKILVWYEMHQSIDLACQDQAFGLSWHDPGTGEAARHLLADSPPPA
jgi:predicted GIY-YIG superfamily endonuclease